MGVDCLAFARLTEFAGHVVCVIFLVIGGGGGGLRENLLVLRYFWISFGVVRGGGGICSFPVCQLD